MKELEIKLLNINVDDIKNKLNLLGAKFDKIVTQKIYTYDCYDPVIMYNLAVSDYKITKSQNSLRKIINILNQLKPIFDDNDKTEIKNICGKH